MWTDQFYNRVKAERKQVTRVEKRQFGQTDMRVSVLGFGGSEIGYEEATQETVERLLGSALDAGLNVIDTAECYVNSEELIGKAVSHRRQDYYLFTKCGHASGFTTPDWDVKMLEESISRSLRNLRTDYVDLIQLHSCSEALLQDGAVIEVLQRAKDSGKVRYIGYSGDGAAAHYAIACGAFDTLQTSLNIADQEPLFKNLPLAKEQKMGVIVKRPIANAAWRTGSKPKSSYHHTYWERLKELDYDFLHGDIDESIRMALGFTLASPGVHTAIVGTTNPARWQQNAELLAKGPLDEQEYQAIRKRFLEIATPEWVGQT